MSISLIYGFVFGIVPSVMVKDVFLTLILGSVFFLDQIDKIFEYIFQDFYLLINIL